MCDYASRFLFSTINAQLTGIVHGPKTPSSFIVQSLRILKTFRSNILKMLRIGSLKNQSKCILQKIKTYLTPVQSGYVTFEDWKKLSKSQLKDTPADSLIWNTPEVCVHGTESLLWLQRV
jgi:hypothetical protein